VRVGNGFVKWLNREMEARGWSQSELARRASVSRPTVSNVLMCKQTPSFEFCASVATALGEPPERLLRLAGLLPGPPMPPEDGSLRELIEIARGLSPEERQELREYALWRYRRRRAREGE